MACLTYVTDAWSPTQPRTATPPPPPPPARPSLSPAPRPDDNGNDADRSDGHPEYDDQDAHYSAPQLRHAEYRAERDLKDDDNGDNDDDDDDDARRFYDGEERERQPLPPLPMAPRSEGRSETGSSDANPGNNLHVSGVSKLLTDQQLEEPFSKFGKVRLPLAVSRARYSACWHVPRRVRRVMPSCRAASTVLTVLWTCMPCHAMLCYAMPCRC